MPATPPSSALSPSASPRPPPSPAPGEGSGLWQRRLRIGLGTWISIEACANSAAVALAAIAQAFTAVAEVEARMHPERAGSDVARINGAALHVPTPIDASTLEVLRLARRLNALTEGVFDPCLPLRPGRLTDLELGGSVRAGAWVICRAPVALDLGGIAKGYAIDCAIDALRAGGCHAGGVNAGGDLRLFGARCETVLLRLGDGGYQPLALQETALAVSDLDEPRRPPGHRGYYSRGQAHPAARRYAVVLAPTAISADALTKCLLLAGAEAAERSLRELGGRDLADHLRAGEPTVVPSPPPGAERDPVPTSTDS